MWLKIIFSSRQRMNRSILDNVSEQYGSLAQYNILVFGMKNIVFLLGGEWVEGTAYIN